MSKRLSSLVGLYPYSDQPISALILDLRFWTFCVPVSNGSPGVAEGAKHSVWMLRVGRPIATAQLGLVRTETKSGRSGDDGVPSGLSWCSPTAGGARLVDRHEL